MDNTFLAIDVGNTSVTFGLFRNDKLKNSFRIPTKLVESKPSLKKICKELKVKKVKAVCIASVVPKVNKTLKKYIAKKMQVPTYIIGEDLKVPIKNRYEEPSQVGTDRLMNALAAYQLTHQGSIILDFGTAITFDVVSAAGEYLGGVIAPGIEISLEALYKRTALLPRIQLVKPRSVLGRDTIESIRSGCAYGIGGLCDRLIEKLEKQFKTKPAILATGGYAPFMANYCERAFKIYPNLVLQGIYLTYKNRLDKK